MIYDSILDTIGRTTGLQRFHAIHLNDSKGALGSKLDRHEHIGKGEIGPKAFEMLVNDPRFERIPILLETPIEDEGHAATETKVAKAGLSKSSAHSARVSSRGGGGRAENF